MTNNKVIEIKNVNEFKELTDKGAAIVKYSAQWCGPCIRIAPQYKDLAKQNKNINFLHVDIDEALETLPNQVSNIFSVPTFHYMFDGEVVEKQEGANLVVLKEKVAKLRAKSDEAEKKKPIASLDADKKENKGAESKEDSNTDETPKASSVSAATEEKGKVIEVTEAIAYNKYTSTGKCVFDFSASWCMPCKILMPVYTKLAAEFTDVQFLKIDVDEVDEDLDDIISNLKIVAVPSFLFYNNGKLVDRMSGGNPISLKSKVETLAKVAVEKEVEKEVEKKVEKEVKIEEEKQDDEKKVTKEVAEKEETAKAEEKKEEEKAKEEETDEKPIESEEVSKAPEVAEESKEKDDDAIEATEFEKTPAPTAEESKEEKEEPKKD